MSIEDIVPYPIKGAAALIEFITGEKINMDDSNSTQTRQPSVEAAVVNALMARCWQTSDDHAFHDDWTAADELEALAEDVRSGKIDELPQAIDNAQRLEEIAVILRNNVLSAKFMLIVTEVAEAMESLRKEGADGVLNGAGNVPEELADVIVRVLDTSGMIRQPIGDALLAKMEVNDGRPRKHGKEL